MDTRGLGVWGQFNGNHPLINELEIRSFHKIWSTDFARKRLISWLISAQPLALPVINAQWER